MHNVMFSWLIIGELGYGAESLGAAQTAALMPALFFLLVYTPYILLNLILVVRRPTAWTGAVCWEDCTWQRPWSWVRWPPRWPLAFSPMA